MPGGAHGATTTSGMTTSGSGALDLSSIAGLAARYDFSIASSLTVVSNDITAANDLSGNGFHLTQGGNQAGSKTISNTTLVNGLVAATFPGGDSYGLGNTSVSVAATNTMTVFAVVKGSATTNYERVVSLGKASADDFDGVNRIAAILRNATNLEMAAYYNSGAISAKAMTNGAAHVVTSWRNGDSHVTSVDGSASTTTTGLVTTNFAFSNIAVGAYIGASGDYGTSWTGQIGEIIWYNAALSAGNRQAVETYLKQKWGTP